MRDLWSPARLWCGVILAVAACAGPPGATPATPAASATPTPGATTAPTPASATATPPTGDATRILESLTWVAQDPDTGAWFLGRGAEHVASVNLGENGVATTDFGSFATVAPAETSTRIGLGNPATPSVSTNEIDWTGASLAARADASGTWVFVHAGDNGHDAGVMAISPVTGEQRTIVAGTRIDLAYQRNNLLWSPSGRTVVSTLCNQRTCFVDVVDAATFTARRLDAEVPVVATTDSYLLAHGADGDAWQTVAIDTGTVVKAAIDPTWHVRTVLPIDDTHVVLDAIAGATYTIAVVDLATGAVHNVMTAVVADEQEPALQLMKLRSDDPRHVLVGTANSFSVALAELGAWPIVRVLDLGTGQVDPAELVVQPAP